jgi:hypothetical protein
MTKTSATIITTLLCAATCLAGLEWESRRVSQIVLPSTASVTAEFRFKNTGNAPVTIVGVDTSCGCTTAELGKKVYEPGESGSISATMKLSGGTSRSKMIYVQLQGVDERVTLTIAAEVPAYLSFDRTWTMWWRDEEPGPKTLTATVGVDGPVNIVSIKADPGNSFTMRKDVVEPGRKYKLTITPADTSEQNTASFIITTDSPPESPAIYQIKAQVLHTRNPNTRKSTWRERLLRLLPEL